MIILEPNEKINLVTRRHRFILLKWLVPEAIIFVILAVFMICLFFINLPDWPDFLIEFFPAMAALKLRYLALFFLSLLLQFFWLIIFLTVINYYFDCWIVTDRRTIHTELRALFSRIMSSVYHHRIQDITIDVHGIMPTLLRFGNLKIQTAGAFREFIFQDIPEPFKVKELIFHIQKKAYQGKKDKSVTNDSAIEDKDEK